MEVKIFLLIITILGTIKVNSQGNEKLKKGNYLTIQTGGMVDGYNSIGFRTFIEYQRDLKKSFQYAVSFEQTKYLYSSATDFINELSTNLSLLSLNGYYKLNFWKEKIFLTGGIGVGAVYANWGRGNKIGATVNGSLTLNFRITKRIYIETMPVLALFPFNRIYYSNMNAESHTSFYAFTVIPIGLKLKL